MLNETALRQGPPAEQVKLDRWSKVRAVTLGVLLAAAISAVLLIDFLPSNQVLLNAGDVSSVTILAPYDLTYESEIRTQDAQDAQAASIQDIYDPPDASIARQQEVIAQQILDYISTVREDPYAGSVEKIEWLTAIPDLSLSPAGASLMLALNEEE
jgi:membrane-associated HD superfamily phosphohydrolase